MNLKSVMRHILTILFLSVLGILMFIAMEVEGGYLKKELSEYYILQGVRDTGAINLVTAIYLNYRAYDTLGEATVLFVAVLGVVYLLSYEDKRDKNS